MMEKYKELGIGSVFLEIGLLISGINYEEEPRSIWVKKGMEVKVLEGLSLYFGSFFICFSFSLMMVMVVVMAFRVISLFYLTKCGDE